MPKEYLPKDVTLTLAVRYDHSIPFGAPVLPKVERFFAGGDTTIRGLEEDRAWTERVEIPVSPVRGPSLVQIRPQGGNVRLLTNVDLQFPIWRESLLFGFPIMGAVFFDNGVVTNSLSGLKLSDFRQSVGVAFLRIMTPVGASSFEWA